jgi:hypothetical protein
VKKRPMETVTGKAVPGEGRGNLEMEEESNENL